MFNKFMNDESGASAVEYIFLVAVIGVGMTAVYTAFGVRLADAFDAVSDQVVTAGSDKQTPSLEKTFSFK